MMKILTVKHLPSVQVCLSTVAVAVSAHVLSSYLSNVIHNRRFHAVRNKKTSMDDDEEDDVPALQPPRVFSWIPFVGSGVEMGQGILKFIRKYSQQFNSPIFSAVVGGKVCHFFASSEDVTIGFWPTPKLDQSALGKQFLINALGCTKHDCDNAYNDRQRVKQVFSLIQKHVMTKESQIINVEATQRVLKDRFDLLDETMSSSSLSSATKNGRSVSSRNGWYRTSLFDFTLINIFAAAVGPLISNDMATDEAARDFLNWDEGIPLLFGGVPEFLLKQSVQAREKLVDSVMTSKFWNEASELTKGRRSIYHDDDVMYKRGVISIVFASVGNSFPSVFWTMAHVLSDRDALEAVVKESRSFQPDPKTGFFTIEQLDRMDVIKSVWYEAIRLYLQQFTARDVVSDIEYKTKATGSKNKGRTYLLKTGTRIMANVSVRHHDPDIFDDPGQFKWDRFVPDRATGQPPVFTTKDGQPIDEPVVLFGGGVHKCPGRFFIEYEMKSFFANVFSKYDVRLADGEVIPRSLDVETGVGIVSPAGDMMIELKKRV